MVLFHWHPAEEDGLPVRVQPHIHIGPKLLDSGAALTKSAHVPSGRVSVEDVVEFLIRDCRTTPQREDWLAVLTETRDKFRAHANWGTGHPRLHTRAVTGLSSKLAGIKKRAARRKK